MFVFEGSLVKHCKPVALTTSTGTFFLEIEHCEIKRCMHN